MFVVYRLMFWIPAITSAVTLMIAWNSGLLRRPPIAFAWFLVALLLQTVGVMFSPVWAVGLVLQVALALSLIIKTRTSW